MIPPVASRFVAGETAPEAMDHARRVNRDGVSVILNLLGEHYDHPADVAADATAYRQLIEDLAETDLDACVSVKPTQLGLGIGEATFREHYRDLVTHAAEHDVFLWCDMEDSSTTDTTLDAFEEFAREFGGGVGLCVQSNLRRTREDLERLVDVPGKIRLVKGAYDEPPSIAYQRSDTVNERFREDLAYLFRERDGGIAVASHDPAMIDHATDLHEAHGSDFEIQMLMGVREDAQRELAQRGYDVVQYAPYGTAWFDYFYRRVRERRENLAFAVRAIAGR